MRRILLLACVFVMAFSLNGYAADIKIAVCDLQKIAEQSDALKDAFVSLEKAIAPEKEAFEKERKTLEKQASVLQDPKATEKQRDAFVKRQTEYMENVGNLLGRIKDSELEVRLEMDNIILKAAESFAKANNYDFVLDTQNILYQNEAIKSTDVTEEVLKEANELWKKAKK